MKGISRSRSSSRRETSWASWRPPSTRWPRDLAEFRRTNIGEVLQAKNTLEATLEALPDAVVLLDAGCRILSMNHAAATAFRAAGVSDPKALEDLHINGLDREAIARAIQAEATHRPSHGPDAHHSGRTGTGPASGSCRAWCRCLD